MAERIVRNAEFRLPRGTAARWSEVNPVLADGEQGFETDTRRSKVGDGFTAWRDLDYTVADVSTVEVDGGSP